ncbi:MAG TPA: AI-2E family transporter [Rhodocyclaceae bacterium]|nr:AI-2E family transporter [Rhodocyclaceae bacterium]
MPSNRLQTGLWIAFGLAMLWLLYLLSPILAPFLLAGIIAYICNPLVERLQAWRVPRLAAVILVISALGLIVIGLLLILLPLMQDELVLLFERFPSAIGVLNEQFVPWLRDHFGIRLHLDPASLRKLMNDNFGNLQALGQQLLGSLRIGGLALIGVVTTLLLTPVVLFYLLMDWNKLIARIDAAIPRAWHGKVTALLHDIDAVLSEFLRGQLLVMLALAAYYSIALSVIGIPSALPVGIVTGLLIFIPYIGFGIGFMLALLVAALQFEGLNPIIAVLVVYGLGQIIEGFFLTPYLVGDRIGLHPLAVLFSLLAFAQLFGFVGVLIALPTSAALLVGLREVRVLYLRSHFYQGETNRIDPPL